MSTKPVADRCAKVVPMSAKLSNFRPSQQYGCGPIPFVGRKRVYERHLVFDRAIEPERNDRSERFEAFSVLCGTPGAALGEDEGDV